MDGKVNAWSPIRGQPSYEPMALPIVGNRTLIFWLLCFGAVVTVAANRIWIRQSNEEEDVLAAYRAGTIPTRSLPSDFRFITHETTIQEVLDPLGLPTNIHDRRSDLDQGSDPEEKASAVVSYHYELPYNDAVVLLPEPPFTAECRIRSVYYRRPRADDEF